MEEQCKQRFLKGPCYRFVVPFELKLHIDEVHIHWCGIQRLHYLNCVQIFLDSTIYAMAVTIIDVNSWYFCKCTTTSINIWTLRTVTVWGLCNYYIDANKCCTSVSGFCPNWSDTNVASMSSCSATNPRPVSHTCQMSYIIHQMWPVFLYVHATNETEVQN